MKTENTNQTIKFQAGTTYVMSWIGDSEMKTLYTVVRRTEKTIWIKDVRTDEVIQCRVSVSDTEETVYPMGKYSMSPVLRASKVSRIDEVESNPAAGEEQPTVQPRKSTVKEYINSYELLMEAKRELNRLRMEEKFIDYGHLNHEIQKFEEKYFNQLPTVNVEYWYGSSMHYEKVVKISETYLLYGKRMTKSRGFYFIKEIPEITEAMVNRMISEQMSR